MIIGSYRFTSGRCHKTDIITAINTDHLAVVLGVDSSAEYPRGPLFWKFNNSLLDDSNFVQCMRDSFPIWLGEISYREDLRMQGDYIKYKIWQETIRYSRVKSNIKKIKWKKIEERLRKCEEKVAEALIDENLENLERIWLYCNRFNHLFSCYMVWTRWKEYKIFSQFGKRHYEKKGCIRKLLISDGEETTDANIILKEIYDFYSDLYDKKPEIQSDFTGCPFVENSSTVPKVNDAIWERCAKVN